MNHGTTPKKIATVDQLDDGDMRQISVGDTDLLVARIDGEIYAAGTYCSHYGAPLEEGVLERETGCVVCPWHHAVFELDTGSHVEPPGRDCLNTFDVTVDNGHVFVEIPDDASPHHRPDFSQQRSSDNRHFVIVGGGAAGSAALETLCEQGFEGRITLVSNDAHLPYDRPNLSKAYLAGEGSAEWLPLRSKEFYDELDVDTGLETRATGLSVEDKVLECGDHTLEYDKLLVAIGGRPKQLDVPGAELDGIYLLRSRRDCDAILQRTEETSRAVLIGSSFNGMETPAALCTRGLDVDIVSIESEPFEQAFGPQVGGTFRDLHEKREVQFHLDRQIDRFEGDDSIDAVILDDGTRLAADLSIVGVGVAPATSHASRIRAPTERSESNTGDWFSSTAPQPPGTCWVRRTPTTKSPFSGHASSAGASNTSVTPRTGKTSTFKATSTNASTWPCILRITMSGPLWALEDTLSHGSMLGCDTPARPPSTR